MYYTIYTRKWVFEETWGSEAPLKNKNKKKKITNPSIIHL